MAGDDKDWYDGDIPRETDIHQMSLADGTNHDVIRLQQ